MEWPAVVYCENLGCGRKIQTEKNPFSLVSLEGNVEKQKGTARGYYEDEKFVVCKTCTKRFISKFKRRNDFTKM